MSERSETRVERDTSTGRPILVAPGRRRRPLKTARGRDGARECPFCTGAESETPPECDAEREPGTAPDSPGWLVRAFPNKYPASVWHEVVAEGAEHVAQPGRLDLATWQAAVRIWRRRIAFLEDRPEIACAFLFKNVGREAGASIAHNHSQLIALERLPPRLQQELDATHRDGNLVLRELDGAASEGRLVFEHGGFAAFSPRQPKLPGETWLAPSDPDYRIEDGGKVAELAAALRALCAAIDRRFDAPPFNFWLHRVPDDPFHQHFEFQPRTGFLAGLELGADAYINSLPAAESAARLREALGDELLSPHGSEAS